MITDRKSRGQYYTPDAVAASLVKWAVRNQSDRLLDPSCGDGRFLAHHGNATGVDSSQDALQTAKIRCPRARTVLSDFFLWAEDAGDKYDAVVGNPPFIRYQRFNGPIRERALLLARKQGVELSRLSSSWAPFLVVACGLLSPGGRIAFVVPAELGHAPYAAPVLEFLFRKFDIVNVVAIREKIFPDLSEDAWLLYADGFGGSTNRIGLTIWPRFKSSATPPKPNRWVGLEDWKRGGCRLRKHLLPSEVLAQYNWALDQTGVVSLGSLAKVSIGYVSGDNDFFHLSPSQAAELGIPNDLLRVSIRNGAQLRPRRVDDETVRAWVEADLRVLLLNLAGAKKLPAGVRAYLASDAGERAKERYKCRMRTPWYAVPDVRSPDGFLTYMNGRDPEIVLNRADCVCTNSLLAVRLMANAPVSKLVRGWRQPLARLSQELEGHPLGGGMLKLEPGEASRVHLPLRSIRNLDDQLLEEGIGLMRSWRHYG